MASTTEKPGHQTPDEIHVAGEAVSNATYDTVNNTAFYLLGTVALLIFLPIGPLREDFGRIMVILMFWLIGLLFAATSESPRQ